MLENNSRKLFPQVYRGLVEEERASSGNLTLNRLSESRRAEVKEELTNCLVSGILGSVKTEEGKAALVQQRLGINDVIVESVGRMFAFVEADDSASGSDDYAASWFRLAGINNRGMPQQKSQRKRHAAKR